VQHARSDASSNVRRRHGDRVTSEHGRSPLAQFLCLWRAFRDDRPGRRFQNHRERLREGSARVVRVAGLAIGVLLVAGGGLLLVLPGPGTVLLAFGLGLLSGEIRALARWLDRAEPPVRRGAAALGRRLRRLRHRLLRGGAAR
jgi:hypothetical protein